jgi:hypothetical protein
MARRGKVIDSRYQPKKAALEEDVSIDATPEEVVQALSQQARRPYPSGRDSSLDQYPGLYGSKVLNANPAFFTPAS